METSWPSHESLHAVDGKGHEETVLLSALLKGLCPFIHMFGQLLQYVSFTVMRFYFLVVSTFAYVS